MILNQHQIEEIESSLDDGIYVFTGFNKSLTQNLLETVKALRKENEAQRELLKKAESFVSYFGVATDCKCKLCSTRQEVQKQIEEHLK